MIKRCCKGLGTFLGVQGTLTSMETMSPTGIFKVLGVSLCHKSLKPVSYFAFFSGSEDENDRIWWGQNIAGRNVEFLGNENP